MNKTDSDTTDQPTPEMILGVFDALSHRDWEQIAGFSDPEILLDVVARPDVHASTNEHIWRAVHLHGLDQLRGYLAEFFEALPSVRWLAESDGGGDGCVTLTTEASGIDHQGSPWDARAIINLCERDGRIYALNADITHVAVGADLLMDGGDPRRFFQPFLDQPETVLCVPAPPLPAA